MEQRETSMAKEAHLNSWLSNRCKDVSMQCKAKSAAKSNSAHDAQGIIIERGHWRQRRAKQAIAQVAVTLS